MYPVQVSEVDLCGFKCNALRESVVICFGRSDSEAADHELMRVRVCPAGRGLQKFMQLREVQDLGRSKRRQIGGSTPSNVTFT